jgi:hypothetical protein
MTYAEFKRSDIHKTVDVVEIFDKTVSRLMTMVDG